MLQGSAAQTFSKSDIRRVYFVSVLFIDVEDLSDEKQIRFRCDQGNWLRDYSQAIDIAGLNRMTEETLLIIIQALGFMTFGFATREFLVTPERLGVYLPVVRVSTSQPFLMRTRLTLCNTFRSI